MPDIGRYNGLVSESCGVASANQDAAIGLAPAELAEHVWAKLNLALHLACEAEHERRSCRWESADEYQRQWEAAMAEVKRLLPLVRKSGVSIFATTNPQARSGQERR